MRVLLLVLGHPSLFAHELLECLFEYELDTPNRCDDGHASNGTAFDFSQYDDTLHDHPHRFQTQLLVLPSSHSIADTQDAVLGIDLQIEWSKISLFVRHQHVRFTCFTQSKVVCISDDLS